MFSSNCPKYQLITQDENKPAILQAKYFVGVTWEWAVILKAPALGCFQLNLYIKNVLPGFVEHQNVLYQLFLMRCFIYDHGLACICGCSALLFLSHSFSQLSAGHVE